MIFYENFKKYICLPKTLACSCDEYGSVDDSCDENGQCSCKDDYGGLHCDLCMEGMFGFPNCEGKQKFIFYICYIFFNIYFFNLKVATAMYMDLKMKYVILQDIVHVNQILKEIIVTSVLLIHMDFQIVRVTLDFFFSSFFPNFR